MTMHSQPSHPAVDFATTAGEWLERLGIAAKRAGREINFVEVCGTHTVAAYRCGLQSVLPANVAMLSGPGCPVCVTSPGDIDQMIQVAGNPGVIVCTYGDMLPVRSSQGDHGSLESARGGGADVRMVYSSLDAVKIAAKNGRKQVVFAAVGFETTAPATAAAVQQARAAGLTNFTVLASHKRILPAIHALMQSPECRIDGFLCPGHVAVILGTGRFRRALGNYQLASAIVGFEPWQIVQGLAVMTEMVAAGQVDCVNLYPQAVSNWGNRVAQNLMHRVFKPCDARWRGLGVLKDSGLTLRSFYSMFDARVRFGLKEIDRPEPAGCRCGDVITARCKPVDCGMFAKACTPVNPIGPCMVSAEGTCQAWFKYHAAQQVIQN